MFIISLIVQSEGDIHSYGNVGDNLTYSILWYVSLTLRFIEKLNQFIESR